METATTVEPIQQTAPTSDLSKTICNNVLQILGRPAEFLKIQALNVYMNRWRVNLWQKQAIPDSFFIQVDEKGNITSSNPPIVKKYP